MDSKKPDSNRRAALARGAKMLATIGIVVVAGQPGVSAAKKKKAAKEDFYFQEEPGDNGRSCSGCANFEPYGPPSDKGTCALLEGEVCTHCYCQGWVDKRTGKKEGT